MYSSTRDSSSWELGGEGFARAVMAGSEIARTQPARTRPGRRWITRTIAPRSRDAALVSRPTPRVALELLCRYHLLVIRADESNLATPLPRKSETPGGGTPGVREGTKDVIEMRGPRRGGRSFEAGLAQDWSALMISPPARVISATIVNGLTDSLMKCTEPSAKSMFAPPGWNE